LQRVYLDNSNNKSDIIIIIIEIDLKREKRLKELILIITYYNKLESLIIKTKRFINIALINKSH